MKTGTTSLATSAALLVIGITNQNIRPTINPEENRTMNLGKHYIALTVKDLAASKEFYEKLGFTTDPSCGGIKQRWIIMHNGNSMIGLYQGMFPKNIITFNPADARPIYKELQESGMKFEMVQGMENESGACSFVIVDPDGNPVLVDHHDPQPQYTHTEPDMALGAFSFSLAVKDIAASKAFYEKLGFTYKGGDQSQNWLVLKNGDAIIGLFQGMFEKNMLTFNPGWDSDAQKLPTFLDVRELQRRLKEQGVELMQEADEKTTGPGSVVMVDPDGNPILIDQHV